MLVWPTLAQLATATLSNASVVGIIPPAARSPAAEALPLQPNDNRRSGGSLSAGVLTIRLVARAGSYFPEGADQPGIPVFAFSEEGKPLQAPGPMIRVSAGTEVRATVRNALEMPMTLRGLQDHGASALDTVIIAPGATRELRFRAITPGTYFYFGRTSARQPGQVGRDRDSELTGAFIVDAPGVKARADDRVFVISTFNDSLELPGKPRAPHEIVTVNGLSWPGTERFTYTVGDSVHWRVINAGSLPHPMHLHGFYYDVVSKGDLIRDTLYTPGQVRKAVTEFMSPGATMSIRWVPTRALMSAAYLGSVGATWTLDVPDLTSASYDPAWALKSGTGLSWSVSVAAGNVLPFAGGAPVDNAQLVGAGTQGSSPAFGASIGVPSIGIPSIGAPPPRVPFTPRTR